MAAVETEQDLIWRVHPARERPVAAVFALLVIAAVCWLVALLMESPWWAILPAVFFLLTLQRFFFPNEFRIDREGITAESAFAKTRFHWSEIRRFRHDEHGGFLSTRRRSSMFDGFRGMHLVFQNNHDQVVARIQAQLPDRT